MDILLAVAPAAPAAAAILTAVTGWRPFSAWAAVAAAATILGCGIALAAAVGDGRHPACGSVLRADALTVTMLIVVGVVGLLACWAGVGYIDHELTDGDLAAAGARRYGALTQGFLAAMVLAVTAANLGVTWVGIEATTVITAFLVAHRGTRPALEATWKYVTVCSVGITMALLGTVLLYYAARHGGTGDTLDWTVLRAHAAGWDPAVTRTAAGLLILGYGAKAGLVPFHTWLADAHSQAPAPVSALMSGVLLAVAMSVIVRLRPLLDPAAGAGFVRDELLVVGLLTLTVAALLMTVTPDLKRLLAYSSMENMGLIAVAAAAGSPIAVGAIGLHVLAHGGGKTVLFLAGGQLQHAHRSAALTDLSAVLRRHRLVGASFAAGVLILAGLPPFALFASEIAIARGLAAAHLGWVLAVAFASMVIAFAALLRAAGTVLLGEPDPRAPAITAPTPVAAALVIGVAASLALGVTAGPLAGLFEQAATQQVTGR